MTKYIDKQIAIDKIDSIIYGIKLKDIDTITSEIYELKQLINDYRQPHQCNTCEKYPCNNYKNDLRNCSGWK